MAGGRYLEVIVSLGLTVQETMELALVPCKIFFLVLLHLKNVDVTLDPVLSENPTILQYIVK